ncbi:zinc finger HIT domain-containing protein 3 [Morus notabilis]|uniref:zinc finger HIT domain-containing protein 3 n=1 Tax=Morus notabilis TaxID=981085 RepID=UPI000CED695D|nr:zinc finger HIT domain-containing protein 3 [Morus notabilis]
MGPKQCLVCNQAASKYKCPSCLLPYCSLTCFKKHKEIPCSMPVASEQNQKSTANPESRVERPLNVDEPGEVVKRSQHEATASSSDIRDALKDEDLQKLICAIDSSLDPESELDKAMEVEVFRTFTNKILSTISS